VVVGAGFAGLAAAKVLSRFDADVTLVDRRIYSTFQPLLYQVATGGLNPGDVAYSVRTFVRRKHLHYRHGTVCAVDADHQEIILEVGEALPYDYLVLATGAAVNHFGVPGAAEHAFSLYTRSDAIALRDALMARLERRAEAGTGGGLTLVVVGGGPTGIETAGALAELRNAALAVAFPELDRHQMRVVLVEQSQELLGLFAPALRRYTLRQLQRRGVEVRLNTAIRAVAADRVTLEGGESVPADLTVWAAGVTVPPETKGWGLPQGRGGRLEVETDLRVKGHDRIFAAGDLAILGAEGLPQLAQPAIQTGRHAARQVGRLLRGEPTEPFRYRDKGIMATIGRRAAVAQLPFRIHLRGTVAFLAWLGLHIDMLLGHRNRASALLNLSWRYLSWPEGSGIIVGDIPED
jgi:NADH dehydrogenase